MIEKLESAREKIHKIVVIACIVAVVFKDDIKKIIAEGVRSSINPKLILFDIDPVNVLIALSVIFVYIIIESLTDVFIDNIKGIRKLIMRKDDIESFWIDVVFDSQRVVGLGFFEIRYYQGSYVVEGIAYDHDMKRFGVWMSKISSYKDRIFEFVYDASRYNVGIKSKCGYGKYYFTRAGYKKVNSIDGYFCEEGSSEVFFVIGKRVKIDKSKLDEPEYVENILKEYLNGIEKSISLKRLASV